MYLHGTPSFGLSYTEFDNGATSIKDDILLEHGDYV